MFAIIYIFTGVLLVASAAGHIYVRVKMRPAEESDVNEYYHEFEHLDPAYAAYNKWLRITFTGIVISVLVIFVMMFVF